MIDDMLSLFPAPAGPPLACCLAEYAGSLVVPLVALLGVVVLECFVPE